MTTSYPNNVLETTIGLFIRNMAQVWKYFQNNICVKKHERLKKEK